MQKGSWFVRPVMVDVKIGEPVETTGCRSTIAMS
jgi:hypothetical protein